MSPFSLLLLVCLTINNLSEASHSHNHKHKLHPAIVVGTVLCDDTCFQESSSSSRATHFISGASVAVECKDDENSRSSFRQEVKTNEHGEFKADLPFSVTKHVKKIKRCSVKLVSSSEPNCGVASSATSSLIHLKSRSKQGTHIFSSGIFSFKPSKCGEKPNVEEEVDSQNSFGFGQPQFPVFPPPLQDPASAPQPSPVLNLPPLPQLPPLPPLPGLPIPPIPEKN